MLVSAADMARFRRATFAIYSAARAGRRGRARRRQRWGATAEPGTRAGRQHTGIWASTCV